MSDVKHPGYKLVAEAIIDLESGDMLPIRSDDYGFFFIDRSGKRMHYFIETTNQRHQERLTHLKALSFIAALLSVTFSCGVICGKWL